MGFEDVIPSPRSRGCLACGVQFNEATARYWFYLRQGGQDRIDYCDGCSENAMGYPRGTPDADQVMDYISTVAGLLKRVPTDDWERSFDWAAAAPEVRTELMRECRYRPTPDAIKALFVSWSVLLVRSGVLPDGTYRTSRGTRTLAVDGHVCSSLGEKTIDDWLYDLGIPHEREPHYPESNLRADFRVGDAFVEYFGLAGNAEYDAKIIDKRSLAPMRALKLVEIYPADLARWSEVHNRFAKALGIALPRAPAQNTPQD